MNSGKALSPKSEMMQEVVDEAGDVDVNKSINIHSLNARDNTLLEGMRKDLIIH